MTKLNGGPAWVASLGCFLLMNCTDDLTPDGPLYSTGPQSVGGETDTGDGDGDSGDGDGDSGDGDGDSGDGDGDSGDGDGEPDPFCGDGTTDPGEACDDGNTMDGDGCSGTCMIESCGDGIMQ